MSDVFTGPDADDDTPRVTFSASDVRTMVRAGVLDANRRYEVIDGEIIPVQAHNPPHMRIKRHILRELSTQLGRTCWVDSECTLYLEDDGDYTLPDVLVYPAGIEAHDVRGPQVLLLVEVADATFKKDRQRKAALYARFGIREYWVVNALTMKNDVFTEPTPSGYGREQEWPADAALSPAFLPGVTVVVGAAGS
jgi:Uma2 family endonuclease